MTNCPVILYFTGYVVFLFPRIVVAEFDRNKKILNIFSDFRLLVRKLRLQKGLNQETITGSNRIGNRYQKNLQDCPLKKHNNFAELAINDV
jgi:hypothetical protein